MKCVTLLVVAFLLCATVVNAQTIFGVPKQICGTQTITAAIGNFTSSQPLVITVSTSSPLVTVSPSTVTFTRNGTEQDITIGCNQIGPVEITFAQSSAGIGLRQSFFAFCAGSISVSNPPQSVRRGDEFSLDVVLSPTPSKEVNVIVESLDPYIIPGSERIIFAVQQSIANQLFYAPKAGVGPARIIFNSRSLRDYTGPGCAELVIDINVQGEISTNLNDIVVGQNSTVLVTVTISPPAETDNIIINIDTQGLGFAPASLNFSLGQSEQTFNFTLSPEVLSGDSGCIALGGDFYEKTLSCFGIAGSFRTNIDSEVNTFANEVFSLDLLPNAGGAGVSVNVESSPNVRIIGDFEIPAYGSNTIFILDAVAPGPAFVEFSADGYAKLLYNFTVISVGCTANQSISSSGEYCVNCPSLYSYRNVSDPDDGNFQYDICDGSGTCSFSTFNPFVGRCVCDSFNFGPSCQFFVLDEDDIVAEYGVGSQIMSITTDIIPLTRNTTINFSSTMVTGENAGDIAFFLQPYGEDYFPFTGSASPFLLPPTVINKTAQIVESGFRFDVTTEDYFPFTGSASPFLLPPTVINKTAQIVESGFRFDVTTEDNTPVRTLNSSIEFIFQFRKNLVTQAQFLQLQLFYFDEAIESFVPASETCVPYAYDKDIYTYTVRVFLCRTGQYQFFSVGPKAAHQIVTRTSAPQDFNAFDQDRYFLGSNQFGGLAGGENGRIPPQPTFVQQTIVEQQAIDQARLDQISLNQASSASYVHASVFAVLLAVALALI